jgi:predicted anti-sigma-YlaC factor YlaD
VTCRDAIDLLGDFLASELGPRDSVRLRLHLAGCRPCRAYLRTYRRTVRLAGRAGEIEMPEEMKRRLRAFLVEKLAEGGEGRRR